MLFVLALSSVLVGLVFLFKYDTTVGVYGVVGVFFVAPLMTAVLLRYSPLRRLAQAPDAAARRIGLLAGRGQ